MSEYSGMSFDELLYNFNNGFMPLEVLFEEIDELLGDEDKETMYLLTSLEEQLTDSEKENRRLRQDVRELEQKLEDIRRIL